MVQALRSYLRHTSLDSTPLEEWSARHRDRYLITHSIHNRHPSIHALGGIRTRNFCKRAAADPRLRPRCHWDKGKAFPLQAWSGPEDSRKIRFPDFMTTVQDGGKVVSLTHRPSLPPRKCSWYSFLLEAEWDRHNVKYSIPINRGTWKMGNVHI